MLTQQQIDAAVALRFERGFADWRLTELEWREVAWDLAQRLEDWAEAGIEDRYAALADGTAIDGRPDWHHVVAGMLWVIAHACQNAGLPMLTALVFGKATSEPGPGSYDVARELGRLQPGQDPMRFWIDEINLVHRTWRD